MGFLGQKVIEVDLNANQEIPSNEDDEENTGESSDSKGREGESSDESGQDSTEESGKEPEEGKNEPSAEDTEDENIKATGTGSEECIEEGAGVATDTGSEEGSGEGTGTTIETGIEDGFEEASEVGVEDIPEDFYEENDDDVVVSNVAIEDMPEKKRLWSFLVYMSADNNLESAAIEDMIEMECSHLDTDVYSVFVLLDRSASYDTSDSNWTGTKLFKLQTERAEDSKDLISTELECKDLNLRPGQNTELDMSSSYVLSDCLNFIRKMYPAENYGFVMWGHGTGWRSSDSELTSTNPHSCLYKGFAFDETSGTYMTLSQLRKGLEDGLKGEKLSFLGFDTCFGASIEVMYELRNCSDYAVGSEGLLMSSGWNYKTLFNAFNSNNSCSGKDFALITLNKFKQWYEYSKGASFTVVNMSSMGEYFSSFDNLMAAFADNIYSRSIRDELMGILYSNIYCETEKYTYGSKNSDVYLDITSMVEQLSLYFTASTSLVGLINNFENAINNTILGSWTSSGTRGGLSVYFSSLSDGRLLSVNHPAKYVNGKTVRQIDFVSHSQGYVPNITNDDSFLGKLFYKSF